MCSLKRFYIVVSSVLLLAFTSSVQANVTYRFAHIPESGDGPTNIADGTIGEAQTSVTVSDYGSGQVLFTFDNSGDETSSISEVYFDDATDIFSLMAYIDNSDSGVDFDPYDPSKLPKLQAGNGLTPAFTTDFAAGATSPPVHNGVNPDESLGIVMTLKSGFVFSDTIAALNSLDDLRIGIKVQGFDSGGSETFVTTVIPAPGALLLGGIGLTLLSFHRRRKKELV